MLQKTCEVAFVALLILCDLPISAQGDIDRYPLSIRRNSFFVHGGHLDITTTWGIHYERKFYGQGGRRRGYFVGKGTVGKAFRDNEESWYLQAAVGFLTGQNALHLEMYIGYAFFIHEDFVVPEFFPNAASAALRYEKPGGPINIRFGIGWPETLFLGAGYCFGY